MVGDHTPHVGPHVVRLCWNRGYVLIPHGDRVTPLVQTVDTNRNQAVKARYQALEVAALVRLMRDGVAVPHLAPDGLRGPHGGGLKRPVFAPRCCGWQRHDRIARVFGRFFTYSVHRQGSREFLEGTRHAQESELHSCGGQTGDEAGKDTLVVH